MQEFPHHYVVEASASVGSTVSLASSGLARIETAGPPEFGGSGDLLSPETLLVAAVADCFILSFRAIARKARFDWKSLVCDVVGDLDSVDGVTQFTGFSMHATLEIPEESDQNRAGRLLEKAERHCLITNSLKAESHLDADIKRVGLAA
jgi:organic hydroperoxide reductase OsmC/OhrA